MEGAGDWSPQGLQTLNLPDLQHGGGLGILTAQRPGCGLASRWEARTKGFDSSAAVGASGAGEGELLAARWVTSPGQGSCDCAEYSEISETFIQSAELAELDWMSPD